MKTEREKFSFLIRIEDNSTCIYYSCSVLPMSPSVDGSPKSDEPAVENSVPKVIVKDDESETAIPPVAEHQDIVDAIWPILMKQVEGMWLFNTFGLSVCR